MEWRKVLSTLQVENEPDAVVLDPLKFVSYRL